MSDVVIDATGALMGGASRFLSELRGYIDRTGRDDIEVLDGGGRMSARWVVRRELEIVRRRPRRVIALNNLSFQTGGERTVLLRNALHFLDATETASMSGIDAKRLARQSRVICQMARRADRIVVPSASMAERVRSALPPAAARRVTVRAHPLSPSDRPETSRDSTVLLCPVLDAPYKGLATRLRRLIDAVAERSDLQLRLTMSADAFASPLPDNVVALGRLDLDGLIVELDSAGALVFPLTVESFGYPLAEARSMNIPVLAPDTALTREVAASSLVPCDFTSSQSVDEALDLVRSALPSADVPTAPFDPDRYFAWLIDEPIAWLT